MNSFFEFSHTQTKMLGVLAIAIVLGAGYRFIRDYYLHPSQPPRPWRMEFLNEYHPTLVLDLNFAPADSLELIPGIGPVLAERIIAYRDEHGAFTEVDSLVNVAGIGEAKLRDIKKFLKVTRP